MLSFTNKLNKNSLMILLELHKYDIIKELIEYDFNILSYKNFSENNFFKTMLSCEYFYDYINLLINTLDYNFIIKLLSDYNNVNINFIDTIINLLSINQDIIINNIDINRTIIINQIIVIIKSIYNLNNEQKLLIITKLCKNIDNSEFLFSILKAINIENFDLYPDDTMITCIDYLILNEDINVLEYMIYKINYIYFINIENNNIFKLWDQLNLDNKRILSIIFNILGKSNILKLKNNKNQNIFYKILEEYQIDFDVLIKYQNQF